MSDFRDHVGDGTSLQPPPPVQTPTTVSREGSRFSPKRLVVIFVVVLVAVVSGTLVANTLSNSSPTDQAMGNWMSSYGAHYLNVSHDVGTVSSAGNSTSLRRACVKLQGDVGVAESDPAMPLNSLQSQWSLILANLSTAANDCVTGIDQQSPTLLDTAQSHMADTSEAYIRLVKAVQRAGN